MLKKYLFGAMFCASFAWAQECKPVDIPGFKTDLCYSSKTVTGRCAQFSDTASVFYFKSEKAKKPVKLALGDGQSQAYLISLASNKTLKLSALDLIFLQEALSNWGTPAERLVKKVSGIKRTSEELKAMKFETTETGLGINIIDKGTGVAPTAGKNIKAHYRGYLEDGSVFDASFDRGQTFEFPLGMGRVIKGWDQGFAKMKVGDHAILKIPAELGYGSRGAGGAIPPNATLYFEVILMDVQK